MGSFETFCGGPFWNQTLLQNNTWPELTFCFRSTLLIWAPCAYLWIAAVIYIPYTFSRPRKPKLPFTALNLIKTLCCMSLMMLGILDMSHLAGLEVNGEVTAWARFTGYLVEVITFVLAIALTQLDRAKGVFSSGVLFVFWTLMLIASVVPLYTYIMLKTYEHDILKFCFFSLKFSLISILFLLHWFSDLPGSRRGYFPLGENPCPEVTASFPSRRIFWWMTKLVILGYRKGIQEVDLWNLNPRDTCRTLVPPFESKWRDEATRVNTVKPQMKKTKAKVNPAYSYHNDYRENSPLLKKHHINISTSATSSYTESLEKVQDGDTSRRQRPSLFRVLWKLYGGRIILMSSLTLTSDTLKLAGPLILSSLISFVSNKSDREAWWGYVLASALLALQLVTSVIGQAGFAIATILGMHIKTTCISAVYKKALTLNNEAKKTTTSGEIVNLMSVDIQRICDVMTNLALLSSVPIQIVVSITMIYQTIGASVFSGLGLLLVLLPLNAALSGRQKRLQTQNLRLKGERIKLVNEVLNGIKVLKLYAWETSFKRKIESVRRKEVDVLLKISYLSAGLGISWTLAPFLVVLATFATYIFSDPTNQLDANKAFVTLSLFNILRVPMNLLPGIITSSIQAFVSTRRVNEFLCSEDLSPENVQTDHQSDYAVQIINGTFTWDRTMEPTLSNINLNIREGALVAIVGQVASGKTSVISAILGEMEKISGTVTVQSSTGYVPQQAWIQNCSLRDNIVFGKRWREKKYKTVIDACALKDDLALLPAGDKTEIGEKGINLSGGQKQRVSLARAVYSNSDIYLFDDPLSAVDSHVGKHIFKNVIGANGLLHGKTRILVTHGVHWLPMVDHIIVMNNGDITETGSYDELMSRNGHFAQFLQEYLIDRVDEDEEEDEEIQQIKEKMRDKLELLMSDYSSSDDGFLRRRRKMAESKSMSMSLSRSVRSRKQQGVAKRGMLTEEENIQYGRVKWGVFVMYGRAAGIPSLTVAVLLFLTYQALNSWAGFYLTDWTEDPRLTNASAVKTQTFIDVNYRYLGLYSSFTLYMFVVVTGYGYLLRVRMVRAAARLHDAILSRVFRSPMSFFDTTPYGRIINRLSRDVETIDNTLPLIIRMLLSTLSNVVATLIIISVNTPLFISVLVPLVILYLCIQNFYIPTSRQLKRIESVTRSPIYVHFSETITGAGSIRAYSAVDRFIEESKKRVDKNQVFYFAGLMANRWLAYYLDLISSFVIFASAIFAVITPGTNGGIIGLSVSYALQVAASMSWMVRQLSDLETNIVSVERVKEYAELETEADPIIQNNRPPVEWPEYGRVEFIDYTTRYRPGLDLVLKGLHCTIEGGEKVGIVGRTGAGKSSFTLALFRILEAAGGSIVIDGINIAEIGLYDVRSRLTILPQDPVLFSGSMRMNLDPFNEFSDTDIWQALDRAHLRRFVVDAPGQLMYECGEGGENLSVGQRQLVCLARALLRHTKILVLDEATAAVDMETDSLIQKTIREAFDECTVITIAHRLNTVMDYDKIFVMASGQIQETGSPQDLLKNGTSLFHGMAKDAGLI